MKGLRQFYGYLFGRTGFGVGTGNQALAQPTSLPVDSIYAPRYNAKRDLGPQAPGYLKQEQNFVPVSLLANGIYFQGTLELEALAEFEKQMAVKNAGG
jgi:hypothetical protein